MDPGTRRVASVVIPAHNEARVIGRLLERLCRDVDGRLLEIVVACNGCTDETASIARTYPGVIVLDLVEPSKRLAMQEGSNAASVFPRLYVDADVELDAEAAMLLADAVGQGPVLAAAPTRRLPMAGAGLLVRTYYDVWQRLPQVSEGLFGRGAIALSAQGHARYAALPSAMADDLVTSEAFAPHERQVLEAAVVVVRPPRTVADLLRRRTRVRTGNAQADTSDLRARRSRTTPATLMRMVRQHPVLLVKLPVFLGVSALAALRARLMVRRGDFTTWLRDESSRR